MRKISGDAERHLHKDHNVTIERVDAFAEETRAVQLEVLAELRSDINDESFTLSITAIAIAVFFPITFSMMGIEPLDGSLWVKLIVVTAVTIALVIAVLLPTGIPAVLERTKRVRASMWRQAYEDELARRRSQRGRAARRWQASH